MSAVVDVPHRAVTADPAQDLPFCRLLLATRAHLWLLPLVSSGLVSTVGPGPLLPYLGLAAGSSLGFGVSLPLRLPGGSFRLRGPAEEALWLLAAVTRQLEVEVRVRGEVGAAAAARPPLLVLAGVLGHLQHGAVS